MIGVCLSVILSHCLSYSMKLTLGIILFLLSAVVFTSSNFKTATTQTNQAKPQRKIQLTPCGSPNNSQTVLCGKYDVFENRAAKAGRQITLNLVLLPALAAQPLSDPIFYLAGGPGQGAAGLGRASGGGRLRQELGRERDIVYVDQRGTGDSHRLPCNFYGDDTEAQSYFNEMFPVGKVRACREELEKAADLKLYTTPIAMDDLDEVRAALGYDKINLDGGSYGTQAALQYLRQHPEHVRSVVLAGVATPAMKQPLHFAKGAQSAMDKLIEDCAADETCRAAFPNLKTEFAVVLAKLNKGPVTIELAHPVSKKLQTVTMSRDVFAERLRLMLYDLASASRVPLLIHHAAQGNWVPFGTIALESTRSSANGVAMGMYLTVTCSESAATITAADIERETRGTFLGASRTRVHLKACQAWPRGKIPAAYYQPIKSDVPVLMLSGELDAATPLQFGRAAAQSLPHSRQVLIRNAAHSYGSPCIGNLITDFISKGLAKELDTSCVEGLRRPPFTTELPSRFKQ